MAFNLMYSFIFQTILVLQIVSVFTETLGLSTEITTEISKKQNSKVFYAITNTKQNWSGAVWDCLINGWRLATIESEEEYQEVLKQIAAVGNKTTNEGFWLCGLSHQGRDTFMWFPAGNGVTFNKWHRSQPDHDVGCVKDHCIEINKRFNNEWSDYCCEQEQFYICQSTV